MMTTTKNSYIVFEVFTYLMMMVLIAAGIVSIFMGQPILAAFCLGGATFALPLLIQNSIWYRKED